MLDNSITMKANELMIGDWVNYKGKINRIALADFGIDEAHMYWISEVEPIPLTKEILEKNGFVSNKHVYPYPYYEYINEKDKLKIGFAFPQGNRTSYKEPWVYIDSKYVFIEHLPCIYVHELQHALRLCGIEKEIEL